MMHLCQCLCRLVAFSART